MGIPCSLDPLGSALSIKAGDVLLDTRGAGGILELPVDGIYTIRLVGTGGYGGWRANVLSAYGGGGGSGLKLVFDVYLKKGKYYYSAAASRQDGTRIGAVFYQQYPYSNETTIGAAQGGARAVNREPGEGGTGYIARNVNGYVNVLSVTNGKAGTRGDVGSIGVGGASVDIDGISGKGGDGTSQSGTTIGQNPGESGRVQVIYKSPYRFFPGNVVIERVASSSIYSINLIRGKYKIELVGGGGGQGGFATNSGVGFNSGGAGSGSAFVGTLNVTEASQIFDIYAGHVGSTNRGFVGVGGDGTNSWISEHNNLSVRLYCNSAGTGSGGWSSNGIGGTIVDNGSFVSKYITETTLRQNGNAGEGGSLVGRWGKGGNSVYQGYGRGAGPENNNGTAGLVRITYLGEY